MAPAADAPYVLLVESHRDPDQERALLFEAPQKLFACRRPSEVPAALELVEGAVREGRYVAGFMAYEAGYGLAPKLSNLVVPPLQEHALWFGAFAAPRELRGRAVGAWLGERAGADPASVTRLRFERDREQYQRDFERIQEHLRAGDTYQVCQSLRAHFDVHGSVAALFQRCARRR